MTVAGRRAGLLIPLFSCPSTLSWGIGDIGDVAPAAAWLASAGMRVLQLLPINEMPPGEQSPYSALSAMAIDSIYIRVTDIPDAQVLGDELLDRDERRELENLRQTEHVEYARVRALKNRALQRCFDHFLDVDWARQSSRARGLRAFVAAEAWWLDDYALFRAIHERESHRPWTDWPSPLRDREPAAMATARRDVWRDMLFRQYLQWLAADQWRRARVAAQSHGVAIFGDLPFMVDRDSADVWARQRDFHLDSSVGVPPDAFSASGQDWGMPAYNWAAIAAGGFGWLHERARRSAALYDGYRVDHLVGFYRTYSRPRGGELAQARFEPATEDAQLELGERVLGIFRAPGAEIVAEDLGTVPDFVRASMARLGVPGCRVFRWERHWDLEPQTFRDPADYSAISVAVSGTHDTEALRVWWDNADAEERQMVADIPTVQRLAADRDLLAAPYVPDVCDTLLETLFAAGSALLLLPVQDVFGWSARINEPATVKPDNWTFRLPWPCDRLDGEAGVRERRDALKAWAQRHGRL